MKIALLSDLHQYTPHVHSDVDMAVFAGDFMATKPHDVSAEKFYWEHVYKPYFKEIRDRGIYTIGIPGNHDFLPHYSRKEFQFVSGNFDTFLSAGFREIKGLKFYFYGWCKIYGYAYYRSEERQHEDLKTKHRKDLDFIVTHTPPFDILSAQPEWGSEAIRKFVAKSKPKHAHVFGHCHSAYGNRVIDGVTYANVSYSTPSYSPREQYITYDTETKLFDIVKTHEVRI